MPFDRFIIACNDTLWSKAVYIALHNHNLQWGLFFAKKVKGCHLFHSVYVNTQYSRPTYQIHKQQKFPLAPQRLQAELTMEGKYCQNVSILLQV